MANPRQRRKAKSGLKVSRKPHSVNLRRLVINEPTIQAAWDSTKTVQENFKTIGLKNTLNDDLGSAKMRRSVLEWNAHREKILEEISDIKSRAGEEAERKGVLDMTPLDLGEEAIFGQLNAIFNASSETTDVVKELESKSAHAAAATTKSFKKLGEDDVEYIEALIAKYGKNVFAMARDIKMNYNQHTPKKLEKMIEIYSLSHQTTAV